MTQEVVANAAALSGGLTGNGHVVVNGILFDTGKTDVKPESARPSRKSPKCSRPIPGSRSTSSAIRTMWAPLPQHGPLQAPRRLRGAGAHHQVRRSRRQLDAIGDGPSAPVSSNDTEDGRALNRRVS